MTRQTSSPIHDADGHVLDRELGRLEASVYRTLFGTIEACDDIAARAEALGLPSQRLRARLLASDVRSRLGHAAEARAEQLSLYEAAQPWPTLARHAATYLVSSCDRLGLRVEAMRWAQASLSGAAKTDTPPAWHAEALMVAALFSVSHNGADYTLVDRAMAAVRVACEPVMVAATAANFAEVTAECGELVLASHFADEAEALMLRHPEATSVLSWESVARARLASSELSAAEHAMRESLRLEERFGCCDVNGDPWLTYAEVMLARGDAPGALSMLEHPRRTARETSAWTNTRDLRTRAQVLAALHRWEEAYERMVQYSAAYERTRSIEGDRAVLESSAAVAIDEERRRSAHFERLALTDPLTGLPNRRHAERWLSDHAGVALGGASPAGGGLCVAIADLDHFKRINDTHSHDAGDLVLQRVGTVLLEAFAASGNDAATPMLAARLGGEEFLLAWSGISVEDALRNGNALCERLRRTSFTDIVGGMPVTASLGVACGVRPVDPSALLRAADQCLYQAKRAGRDQVIGTSLP